VIILKYRNTIHPSTWQSEVALVGEKLWSLLGEQLSSLLKQLVIKPGSRLIWLPDGMVGVLPIGLLENPNTKVRLDDIYAITKCTNIQLFHRRRVDKAASLGIIMLRALL
jgi:hypothetical protein